MSHKLKTRDELCGRGDGHPGGCRSVTATKRRNAVRQSDAYKELRQGWYRGTAERRNAERRERYATDPAYRASYLDRYYALHGAALALNGLKKRRWSAVRRMNERNADARGAAVSL